MDWYTPIPMMLCTGDVPLQIQTYFDGVACFMLSVLAHKSLTMYCCLLAKKKEKKSLMYFLQFSLGHPLKEGEVGSRGNLAVADGSISYLLLLWSQ